LKRKKLIFIDAEYNAKGSGLGLVLCHEFVEQHKGKIWAESEPNEGTKICFSIPHNTEEVSASNLVKGKIVETN